MIVFKTFLTSIIIFSHLNTLKAQTPTDSLKLIWTDVNKSDSVRFKSISEFYYSRVPRDPSSPR